MLIFFFSDKFLRKNQKISERHGSLAIDDRYFLHTRHRIIWQNRPFCRIMAAQRVQPRGLRDRLGYFLSFTTSLSSGARDWCGFTSFALIDVVKRPENYTWFFFFLLLLRTRRKTLKLRLIEKKKNKKQKALDTDFPPKRILSHVINTRVQFKQRNDAYFRGIVFSRRVVVGQNKASYLPIMCEAPELHIF